MCIPRGQPPIVEEFPFLASNALIWAKKDQNEGKFEWLEKLFLSRSHGAH